VNKRAIAILGGIFILIVGALGFLIYSRSGDGETAGEEIVTENPNPTPLPTPSINPTIIPDPTPEPVIGRAIRLTDTGVISPILFYQGTGITYLERTGQLFQTDLQTSDNTVLLSNKREISIALKNNITRVLWPLVGNSFIAESDGLSKKSWSYYDPAKAAYVDIPAQVYSLDWMPSGDKIMFIWVDENKKAYLNIGNPDTTGYQVLTDLYEPDNVISISPDGKNVLFHRNQSTDLTKNTINMVSADGKTFRTMVPDGFNKGVKWSPDSNKFLFTKRDSGGKFMLWVSNIITGEIRSLGVATSVDKAVWTKDSQNIFAGVPVKGVAGEGLTEDSIYQINVGTISKVEYPTGVPTDAQEMFLSNNEDILFFKNAQDQSLYYVTLGGQVGIMNSTKN
jgi:hypothetical protein